MKEISAFLIKLTIPPVDQIVPPLRSQAARSKDLSSNENQINCGHFGRGVLNILHNRFSDSALTKRYRLSTSRAYNREGVIYVDTDDKQEPS